MGKDKENENIKILEELMKDGKEGFTDTRLSDYEIKAIRNLIARYKELEGEVEAQLEILKDYKQENEKYKKYYETEKIIWSRKDYIPKSKVKEKIDELKNGTYDAKIILQQLLED